MTSTTPENPEPTDDRTPGEVPPPPAPGYSAPPPPGYSAPPAPGYAPPPPAPGYGPPQGGYPPAPQYGAPQGGYQPPAYGVAPPLSDSDQRLWSVLAHLGPLIVGFLAPLIIWLVFKGRGALVEDQSKESLNFEITIAIVSAAISVIGVVTIGIGFLLFIPLGIALLVFVIMAAVKAGQGEYYRYPLTIRLVK